MSKIWEKDFYKAPIPFIIDGVINEYDISKANISILKDAGYLEDTKYIDLYKSPKQYREIYIGKLQGSNPEVAQALSNGFKEARRKFIELNNINDNNIIDIRKDSISTVSVKADKLQVSPHVVFKKSGQYTSFYRLKFVDIYYNYDVVTGTEVISPRGLGSSKYLHEEYMLDFLSELFYTVRLDINKALDIINNFYVNYINLKLPIGYYREFNGQSMFKFNISDFSTTYILDLEDTDQYKSQLDISFNAYILRELIKYFSSVYFNN